MSPAAEDRDGLVGSAAFRRFRTHVASRRIWLWQHLTTTHRSTVQASGFDRVFNLLEDTQRALSISDWPPYDIVKSGDDSYRISIAVAGFTQDDLDITFQSNLLTVTGKKQVTANDGYLHRGIAGRPFEHRFELADHVKVNGADLQKGLLSIDLVREIPEALKPRKIDIQTNAAVAQKAAPVQTEAQKAA